MIYYNEIDPFAANWLRNLIAAGVLAPGEVDTRSIEEVTPNDIRGFTQCHFFAGIGVWPYALRAAGWPDSRPVWTGSCPCQPFSQAGKGKGFADERHLWPAWHWLIGESNPPVVFGEQVPSPDGIKWLDLVQADLEAAGYACGAIDIPAASVGAPHIRQRVYFVGVEAGELGEPGSAGGGRDPGAVPGTQGGAEGQVRSLTDESQPSGSVGDADNARPQRRRKRRDSTDQCVVGTASVAGFWADAEWIYCRDEKWRPVEPGTFPLAYGAPARVGRLRAYGNALCAPLAIAFIRSAMESLYAMEAL